MSGDMRHSDLHQAANLAGNRFRQPSQSYSEENDLEPSQPAPCLNLQEQQQQQQSSAGTKQLLVDVMWPAIASGWTKTFVEDRKPINGFVHRQQRRLIEKFGNEDFARNALQNGQAIVHMFEFRNGFLKGESGLHASTEHATA